LKIDIILHYINIQYILYYNILHKSTKLGEKKAVGKLCKNCEKNPQKTKKQAVFDRL